MTVRITELQVLEMFSVGTMKVLVNAPQAYSK
jgi:hypothetical protein